MTRTASCSGCLKIKGSTLIKTWFFIRTKRCNRRFVLICDRTTTAVRYNYVFFVTRIVSLFKFKTQLWSVWMGSNLCWQRAGKFEWVSIIFVKTDIEWFSQIQQINYGCVWHDVIVSNVLLCSISCSKARNVTRCNAESVITVTVAVCRLLFIQ